MNVEAFDNRPREPFDVALLAPCSEPFIAPHSDEQLMRESLAMLKRYNVRRAVTSGPLSEVSKWHSAAPDLIIAAQGFAPLQPISVEDLRRL